MGIVDQIEREIPFLRRYARAATGDSSLGDDIIESLLSDLIDVDQPPTDRLSLFARLDTKVAAMTQTELSDQIGALSSDARRALLLTAMEGFALDDVAAIMRSDNAHVSNLIVRAEGALTASLATDVFVIEDEPLVAAHIAQIASQLGHRIIGQAATRDSAIEACLANPPGLLLADVQLADGSSGADAVEAITRVHDIPTIFITAYPQNLLRGDSGEPAFLIAKPFRRDEVKAVISQALIQTAASLN